MVETEKQARKRARSLLNQGKVFRFMRDFEKTHGKTVFSLNPNGIAEKLKLSLDDVLKGLVYWYCTYYGRTGDMKPFEDVSSQSCPSCKEGLLIHMKYNPKKEIITAKLEQIVIAFDEDRVESCHK